MNIDASIKTTAWALSSWALAMLLVIAPAAAQESGVGEPKVRESMADQGQGRERADAGPGQAMPGSRYEPSKAMVAEESPAAFAADPADEEGSMESALGGFDEQIAVAQTLGGGLDSGADQVPLDGLETALLAAPGEPFLTLVLRITRDGESEIVSATEMVGAAPSSEQALSDFVFEVSDGDELLGTQALSGDPFEAHSFGGGPDSPDGHHFVELEETTVTVRVPKRSLDSALDSLKLDLYKLGSGPQVEAFTPSAMQSLRREERLELVMSISGAKIDSYVSEKGTRLEQ